MNQLEQLTFGRYYHIYNRGINSCNLFSDTNCYLHFLALYDRYISPIADTYAWVLMPNHFHLLIQLKENVVYRYSKNANGEICNASASDKSIDNFGFRDKKWETIDVSEALTSVCIKTPETRLHFSHLFNAYSKYYNKRFGRHGNLFERPFKRKLIDNETYLSNVVLYIHHNPVHHGFEDSVKDYPWSSYLTCISAKPTKLKRDKVLEWFGCSFDSQHKDVEVEKVEQWLETDL